MKRCAKCSSLMPDDVTRCVRCGFDSGQKFAPAPAASQQPPARAATPIARQANTFGPAPTRSAGDARARPGAASVEPVAKAGRIRNGWALARQSLRVLMLNKSLLVFPLLSGISCTLVLASFVAGIVASGMAQREDMAGEVASWAMLFAYYFANYFVIVFFNSALVACAMIRFRGGEPTIRDGMRAASERLVQITAWALLAATVGVALRMIESRVKVVGQIVTALLGGAWTLATFFVVPVLVVEKLGPVDAFKRSVAVLRKAWGESLVSNSGVGLITFLVTLASFLLVGIATAILATKMASVAIGLAGMVMMLVILLLGGLVGSALHSIVLSALYIYATENKVPEAFDSAQVQGAFAAR